MKEKKMRKENNKIKLKLINYFYMLLLIHFAYFYYFISKLNNLKIYKILTNFNYILFSFIFFYIETKYEKTNFLNILFLFS